TVIRQTAHSAGVPAKDRRLFLLFQVPDTNGQVRAAGSDLLAVGSERHRHDDAPVPREGEEFLAAFGVPNLYQVIDAARDDLAGVRTERRARHRSFVSLERAHFPAGAR